VGLLPVVVTPNIVFGAGFVAGTTGGAVDYRGDFKFTGCASFAARWDVGAYAPTFEASNGVTMQSMSSTTSPYTPGQSHFLRVFMNAPDARLCLWGSLCIALALQTYVEIVGEGASSAVCGGVRLHPRFTAGLPLFSGTWNGSVTYAKGDPIEIYRTQLGGDGVCAQTPPVITAAEIPPPPTRKPRP
jgi:hypothetical protein